MISRQKGRLRYIIIGVLVLLVLSAALIVRGRGGGPPAVATQTLARADLTVTVQARGVVEAADPVDIRSPFSGELVRVPLKAGAEVAVGDLLAAYKVDDLRLQEERLARDLAQAEASLQDLLQRRDENVTLGEAQLAQAEAQYKQARMDWLDAQGLPPWDKDRARAEQKYLAAEGAWAETKARIEAEAVKPMDETAARAAVTAAREALAQVRSQKGQVELRATVDGTLLEVAVSAGEAVTAGQLLMQVAALTAVEVVAEVDEVDIGQVHAGVDAQVTALAFPTETFGGAVTRIAPTARRQGNVAHFDVWVRVQNPDRLLRPGMSALVTIAAAEQPQALVLPLAALTVREGINGIFIVDGTLVRFQPVITGLVTNTEAEVTAGAAEGTTFVIGPPPVLKVLVDGMTVQVLPPAAAGP